MNFLEDMTATVESQKKIREYVKIIWSETELTAKDFEDLEDFSLESISPILFNKIDSNPQSTPYRKELYRRFLQKFATENKDAYDEGWVRILDVFFSDQEKKDYVARYMTRVLRGEHYRPFHRDQSVAADLIMSKSPPHDVWGKYKVELNELCDEVMGAN